MVLAICGSFLGPRKISAIMPMRSSSDVPIDSRMNKNTIFISTDVY